MRDAIGGLMSIWIIIIFIVLVNGYLAFSANYSKAYNYKNRIINQIEAYDGVKKEEGPFRNELITYRSSMGYSMGGKSYPPEINGLQVDESGSDDNCEGTKFICEPKDLGFCWRCSKVTKGGDGSSGSADLEKRTYTVVTFVSIDIPLLNRLLPLIDFFQVKGDSAPITIRK